MNRQEFKDRFIIEADTLGLDVQVFSDGPMNSHIAFIGEGPGETEVRRGSPFVGGSGTLLWDHARRYNLGRHQVYVTNVVKRQISLSAKSDAKYAVGKDEQTLWESMLYWELRHLPNLRVIFCMGNMAMKAILGMEGITNWRGSVIDAELDGRPIKVVCANNPAYILRELRLEPMFRMDLKKLRQVIDGTFVPHDVETIINPSVKDALDYIAHLKASNRPIATDIETPAWETACVGLSNDSHEAMCINFRDHEKNRFDLQDELRIWQALQDLFYSKKMITQNSYDRYFLWIKNGIILPVWMDTLLAHHTLYPQLPHNLGFLTSQYSNHPYYKDEGKKAKEGGDWDSEWRYNAKDAALTYHVHKYELAELKEQGMHDFFFNHVMRIQPHTTEATVHGVKVDETFREDIKHTLEAEVQGYLNKFYDLCHECTGDSTIYPNPDSPVQMRHLLFNVLGLRGRGISTDETNRKRMIDDPKTPVVCKELLTVLDKYKKQSKLVSTYFQAKTDPDGRMRCEYKQHGVSRAPGRLSSSSTLWGSGMNLQNQPPAARPMFITDNDDCVFIYFDLMQAEAQVVGNYYNIEQWMADFERARVSGGFDCHRSLAAQMFGIPYDDVPTKDFDEATGQYTKRYISKRCRHGLNYRMQEDRLAEVTGLSYFEARKAFQLYHKITPELRKGWKIVERNAKQDMMLQNAYGRRWRILQRFTKEVSESIVAFYPQSTIGDKVSRVWYKSHEDDRWPTGKVRIALNVHDALIGIATKKVAKTALKVMKEHAEEAINITDLYGNKRELIIPAECKISVPTSYEILESGELKFHDDPKGLHRWSGLKDVEI